MRKVNLLRIVMALVLCAAMILPYVPVTVSAAPLGNFDENDGFKGLNISIIGDSISTYEGITNNATYNPLYLSATSANFGTYYGDSTRSDYADYDQVTYTDTWWKQVVDTLGMNLLVNNAWSGSYVLIDSAKSNTNTAYGAAGYKARSVNLHNGSKMPDIIGVFLGTNDVANYSTVSVGSKANIDTASERSALYTSVNSYATPTTSVQAYYIMISRMVATYPDAEIYCMTPTDSLSTMASGRASALNDFNEAVRYIVDYFAGQGKKVYLVDLYNDVGLVDNAVIKDYYYANNVHPDVAGMDWITSCFISELMEHSTKANVVSHEVSYNLTDCYATAGLVRQAIEGKPLTVDLLPCNDYEDIKLTVTMKDATTGETVTIPGNGVDGGAVYIPEVTGPVTVTASTYKSVSSYQWLAGSEALASAIGNGFEYNRNTLVSGTYTGSTDSGTCTDLQYSLQEPVVLEYDKPWELEYKGGGGTYAGGIMLFNKETDSPTSGNMYIHITQTNVFFGYRDSVGYNNSGISWETIASKMGSSAGADYRKETHTFRFVNVPNGTNNKIYLYVDGVQIGTMDSTKMIGASATHASVGNINISGKDFVFNYMGSVSHPLQNCSLSYIKVWENGEANMNTIDEPVKYRWELAANEDAFVSVEDENFVENGLSLKSGSVYNGTFTGAYFKMDKQVVLMHDVNWKMEWVSEGTWTDAANGALFLAGTDGHNDLNSNYVYRRNNSTFIALGERKNGVHNNYGVSLSDNGIDGTVRHKYALINEVTTNADGSYNTNMVYLYVDGVKIGAMNNYYSGGTDTGTTSDWVVGRDFYFSYIGTPGFPVGNCDIEYLQVGLNCEHSYESVVTAPTCTTDGKTVYTCTGCGDIKTEVLAATGHDYGMVTQEATCQEYAVYEFTCSGCGDNYKYNAGELASQWIEEIPEGLDAGMFDTKTQYRYADCTSTSWEQTGTNTIQYVNSWPSGFSTSSALYTQYNKKSSKVTASETATDKTVINSDKVVGYLYYHWCYSNSYYSVASKSGSYTTFHAYYDTTNPSSYTCDTSDMSYETGHSTCSNSDWFFVAEVYGQSYTTYKAVADGKEWSEWSDWSDTAYTAVENTRKVESRTVYQLKEAELADHNYVGGTCTVCGEINGEYAPDYYLFGYINGANYACEEDADNLGIYKFVDGTLTATFTENSYVAVKTGDNVNWYMTNGWLGEEVTSATLYSTAITGENSNKLFVPGGVEFVFTLIQNSDGSLTLSYEPYECSHDYAQQITPPTCTTDGYTTYTCTKCGESYTDSVVAATGHSWTAATCTEAKTCSVCGETEGEALGHSYEAVVTAPTCTEDGYTTYTCSKCGDTYTGDTTAATGHNYVGGTCAVCGATDDAYAPDYYLVGYINGADYGCEGDYANLGEYKFVDGTLTATFTQESYVFIKTGDNANWFMAESYITGTTGTFKNTSTGTSEKMLVPGGVEVTFTLVVNADGSLTLSYVQAEAPVENSPDIKWQVTSGTNASSTSTNLRLLTWVDSPANYSSVTFNVTINGKTSQLKSTTAYTAILASGVAIRNPANIFKNENANYFVTYTLKNIPSSYFDLPIVVTVTWADLEGNETTSESKTIVISSDWA